MMRKCNDCTVCCTVTRVPEFKKPEYVLCDYCCGHSCTIYEKRPQSCKDFECAWLQGDMSDDMRPNISHVMIEILPDIPVVLALPEKGFEYTWRTPENIKALKEAYQDKGITVLASDGNAMLADGHTPKYIKEIVIETAKKLNDS